MLPYNWKRIIPVSFVIVCEPIIEFAVVNVRVAAFVKSRLRWSNTVALRINLKFAEGLVVFAVKVIVVIACGDKMIVLDIPLIILG